MLGGGQGLGHGCGFYAWNYIGEVSCVRYLNG